jgi:hypothetical protein
MMGIPISSRVHDDKIGLELCSKKNRVGISKTYSTNNRRELKTTFYPTKDSMDYFT